MGVNTRPRQHKIMTQFTETVFRDDRRYHAGLAILIALIEQREESSIGRLTLQGLASHAARTADEFVKETDKLAEKEAEDDQ